MTQVQKFRKKPVIVQAYQCAQREVIHTLEGDMVALPGDYIIIGVHGERYPCKPDIFTMTYERVSDDTPLTQSVGSCTNQSSA